MLYSHEGFKRLFESDLEPLVKVAKCDHFRTEMK